MEGESDLENFNPTIDSNSVSDFKLIYPPQAVKLPSRKEIQSAQRCRKSGMVPGAIRKYLMQKKKQEADEDNISDSGSNTNSPGPSNNNYIDVPVQIFPDHDHDHIIEENNDDEINIVGEYPPENVNVLAELDVQHVQQNNNVEDENHHLDSDDVNFTEEEEETLTTARNTLLEAKRMFSEAFSPDSTTPEDIQIQSPDKRQRLERTPSSKRNKQMDSSFNEITCHSPIPGTSGSTRRKKSKHISTLVNDDGPHKRNIFPESPPPSPFIQAPENPKIESSIRKNDWKTVLKQFNEDLDHKMIPTSNHVGDLIRKAILCLGTRVSKDVPALAAEFFNKLVRSYPLDCDESTQYYLSAFTQSSTNSCTMAEFLFDVLGEIQADAHAKVPPKALSFFKSLTKMVINQYKSYKSSMVKLRRPFFVRFLEEKDKILSYNGYCKQLLNCMFVLKDYPSEFKAVMRWVGLLAFHLQKNVFLDSHIQSLVCDFVHNVSKPEYSQDKIRIVQSISDKPLGAAVCLQLLQHSIKFKSVDLNSEPNQEEVLLFLKTVSQSEGIVGLKFGLQERRSEDIGPVVCAPFSNGKKSKKEGVNMKGESYLHRLCRKSPVNQKSGPCGLELDKFLREKRFSVNPVDNFRNTPIMDAIAHERFDALTKFYEYCSDLSLPEDLRVNLLAQNGAGETPFHLAAASRGKSGDEMVQILRWMADKMQVTDEALKILNQQGKMPFELAYTPKAYKLLKPSSIKELPYEVNNVKVDIPSRTALQSLDVKRLIALWSEFSSINE